jgi:hypothetical protein
MQLAGECRWENKANNRFYCPHSFANRLDQDSWAKRSESDYLMTCPRGIIASTSLMVAMFASPCRLSTWDGGQGAPFLDHE